MDGKTIGTIVLAILGAIFWSIVVFAELPDLAGYILASLGTLCWVGAVALGPFRWIFRLVARRTTKIEPR